MISKNALKVLEKRYLLKNSQGNTIETVDEMFKRVANYIAKGDLKYNTNADIDKISDNFYSVMNNLEFLPNSPTLMNSGKKPGQLSACFVLPVEDSMEGIFDAIKNAALIHKSGGGTGFSFSHIRQKGATVASTGGVASGPVSFMTVFNAATEAVKQGGTRRGANMGILRVDHTDILEFIQCKNDNTQITNFNLSIGITEEFMKAVESDNEYSLTDPHTKKITGRLNAKRVFDLIVEMAWKNGEPGIIFLDRINKANPTPSLGDIESTNPCGEQPLLPYESCNLGSINLSKMITFKNNKPVIDFKKLEHVVYTAIHFLDNVIDVNHYPLHEIEIMTKKTRKIGLGVMGFADMLIQLGIPYNSEEGIKTGKNVMEFINIKSKEASQELAKQRGTFPEYESSIYKEKGFLLRNATTTTIAPTGTISIIAGTSSGIEPLFAISYFRNVMNNEKLIESNPLFEEIAKKEGFYSKELMSRIAKAGSIKDIKDIPDRIKQLFVTAHDISPYWHIKMQGIFQKYVDNAVSKTVNFSCNASYKDVEDAYKLAYSLKCKGVTIYRDGSREDQVLNIGSGKKEDNKIVPRTRPNITRGLTEKVKIGCGNLYITANYDSEGICEVFTNVGRAGGCPSQSEATSRIISIALRSGVKVESIIEQLKGIRCYSTINQRAKDNIEIEALSCPDAIGKTLEKLTKMSDSLNIEPNKEEKNKSPLENKNMCPDCSSQLEYEGGCVICRSCGYSRCG